MSYTPACIRGSAIAVLWILLAVLAYGQASPPKPMTDAEFTALLQARLKLVEESSELDAAAKAKLKDLYGQALAEMEAVKPWSAKTAEYEKLAADAPREIAAIRAALAALPAQPVATPLPVDATLLQIEQSISKRETELERLRKALAGDEDELKGRAARRAKIPEQINEAKKLLAALEAQIQASAQGDDKSAAGSAMRMLLGAQRRRIEQEIQCCERESAAHEARTELLPLRHDLVARQIAQAELDVRQWREMVNQRRRQEAERQVEQASQEAGQAHPDVQGLLEENAKLAAMRQPLAEHIDEVTRRREEANEKLIAVADQFKRIQQKYKAAETNVTNAIGLLLRKQREALPNLREWKRDVETHQQTQRDVQLALLQMQDERLALANLDKKTQDVLRDIHASDPSRDRAGTEAAVREALETKLQYLDALIGDYNTYYGKLVDLVVVEQQLIEQTESCARFIDQQVLWIASAEPLSASDLRWANDAFWWLFGPKSWIDAGRTLAADALANPALSTAALALFLFLFYWRVRFRAKIAEIGEKAARSTCYRFPPTLETALLTLLAAVGWPGLTWYVGWRLGAATDASDLCRAVGPGLTETARVFFALELLRHVCCRQGLGESHFGWSPAALKLLRNNLRWFAAPCLALMAIAVAMAWQERNDRWDSSLGRLAFIAALACFSFVLHRIVRPGGVVFQAMVVERRGGWLDRFRYVWYPLCVLTPAALAVLAAVGYHYTARQLTIRLILTAYVIVGGVVCRALLLRWTLVNQRKLAIEQARQRRAAQSEQNSNEESSGVSASAPPAHERDLAVINTQTRRLVEFSLVVASALVVWCAWGDVLPALGKINANLPWTTTVVAVRETNLPDGKKLEFTDQIRSVKLSDVLLALVVLATTLTAARNIPGLLEMAVLQHLPFDAGARYAVATVCRYLITVVGLLFCFGLVGIGWSKVQWLVAAMGLGLGFGLQEIFANFISGLIILFERPVRVGDVVTIDGVTGAVSRIRMRATTITDWDRKELIIPNKEFITGRVLNWTLSDPVNRVVVNVGVAYGADTERAAQILLNIAKSHPHVLADPPPRVSFESFGESSLNFVVRCFLPNLENRLAVIHDLHMAIEREFRAAGIPIPFPQRDIHVHWDGAGEGMARPTGGGAAPWPLGAVKRPAAA